jgi:CHAT domain-containing protein
MLTLYRQLWEAAKERKPHVVWCAAGPIAQLPLHAAGLYGDDKQPKAFDFIVSSYTPSLSALIHASETHNTTGISVQTPAALCVFLAETPHHPSAPKLPGTVAEADILLQHFLSSFTHLNGPQETVSEVLSGINQNSYLHLACHGTQDREVPTNSAFLLYDGSLTLSKLIRSPSSSGELAFLSACETSMGDATMPDEAAHLAAGLLACGFRAVVGTMWAINDADAPLVTDTFYAILLEERRRGVGTVARTGTAYALDEAVGKLREQVGEERFGRWIPFIHFGA